MKAACFVVCFVVVATLAQAEDMAQMISQYRQEHGLSAVKTDAQLTAIAGRQANAMAASGILDHSLAGSFASRISDAHLAWRRKTSRPAPKPGLRRSAYGTPCRLTMPTFCNPTLTALG